MIHIGYFLFHAVYLRCKSIQIYFIGQKLVYSYPKFHNKRTNFAKNDYLRKENITERL